MGGTGGSPVALGGPPKAPLRVSAAVTDASKNHRRPPLSRSLRERSARRAAGQYGRAARFHPTCDCADTAHPLMETHSCNSRLRKNKGGRAHWGCSSALFFP